MVLKNAKKLFVTCPFETDFRIENHFVTCRFETDFRISKTGLEPVCRWRRGLQLSGHKQWRSPSETNYKFKTVKCVPEHVLQKDFAQSVL